MGTMVPRSMIHPEASAMDTNILVSVAKLPERDLAKVSADLKQAGMNVVDVLKLTRVVTGSADQANIPKLRKVPGVTSVELDVEFTPR